MAEAFEGFTCWALKDVFAVAPIDAVTPSDAVFSATHHPLAIVRKSLEAGADRGVVVDEKALLDHFTGPNDGGTSGANDGLMIVPIVGDSGTGKSHLVRWLRANVGDRSDWHIVYVPKWGTNLRRVVELVLEGIDGAVFDEAREKLAQAADSSIDRGLAPERLLNELQVLVGGANQDVEERSDYRDYLVAHLPDFLSDPLVRKTLLESGGVIERFVALAMAGRSHDDGLDEEAFHFTEKDLPVDIARISEASAVAQDVYRNLAGDAQLHATAVALLNEELEGAVRRLFLTSQIQVADVLLEVRRALLALDKELVLFIEDMTVLHGVQRELLNALTEPARRSGEAQLCDLRVAMAVTSGYFDDLDTVATRAQTAYSLDLEYGVRGGITQPEAVQFVGRYLNAARLGESAINGAFTAGATGWVGNACSDCEFRETCHGSFGTAAVDGEEYGLYPFNEAALDRMVRSVSRPYFDARTILREVLHRVLSAASEELAAGSFPSARVVDQFDDRDQRALDPRVSFELQQRDSRDYERRARIITFWAGAPSSVVDLPEGIHTAFNLPLLGAPQADISGPSEPTQTGTDVSPEPELEDEQRPLRVRKKLQQIIDWEARGDQLRQSLAADLRKAIHSSIVDRIEAMGVHRVSTAEFGARGSFFRPDCVRIERGESGNQGSGYGLEIEASPAHALILRAIVLSSEDGSWQASDAAPRLAATVEAIDAWAAEVESAWCSREENESLLRHATHALLFTAKVADIAGASSRFHHELLGAATSPLPEGVEGRSREWDRLLKEASSPIREKLRTRVLDVIGASKGASGSVRALDATRVLPSVAEFANAKQRDVREAETDEAAIFLRKVLDRVDRAIAAEWENLEQWNGKLEPLLDPSVPIEQVHAAVDNAVEKATRSSVLRPDDAKSELQTLRRQLPDGCMEVWREVRGVLQMGKDRPRDQLLADVAPDRRTAMTALVDYAVFAYGAMSQSSEEAGRSLDLLGDNEEVSLADIAHAVDEILEIADEWGSET